MPKHNQYSEPSKDTCLSITLVIACLLFILASLDFDYGSFGAFIALLFTIYILLLVISTFSKNAELKRKRIETEQLSVEQSKILYLLKKLISEQEKKQEKYKEKINLLFLRVKEDQELINIMEYLLPKTPSTIFMYQKCYTYFEFLIWREFEIGQNILWSTPQDLSNLKTRFNKQSSIEFGQLSQNEMETYSFFIDKFKKMTIWLMKKYSFDEESDYSYILLRMIQLSLPCFFREASMPIVGIENFEIEHLSFDGCMFKCYEKFKDNAINDPILSIMAILLIHYEKFGKANDIDYFNFLSRGDEIIKYIKENKEEYELKILEIDMRKNSSKDTKIFSIVDVDLMNGFEFEEFVAKLFSNMGYITEVTKHSGDFGVDVIAEKNDIKIAIQAKCYTKSVTNSAIQEIVAGLNYYHCQRGVVVTNRYFTKSAKKLAESNSITLWDRKTLSEKISDYFEIEKPDI